VAASPGAKFEEGHESTVNAGFLKRNARGTQLDSASKDLSRELEEFASYCFDLGASEELDYHLLRTIRVPTVCIVAVQDQIGPGKPLHTCIPPGG
jgi:hypothetical protein